MIDLLIINELFCFLTVSHILSSANAFNLDQFITFLCEEIT